MRARLGAARGPDIQAVDTRCEGGLFFIASLFDRDICVQNPAVDCESDVQAEHSGEGDLGEDIAGLQAGEAGGEDRWPHHITDLISSPQKQLSEVPSVGKRSRRGEETQVQDTAYIEVS